MFSIRVQRRIIFRFALVALLLTLNIACVYILGPKAKSRPAPNLNFPVTSVAGNVQLVNAFPNLSFNGAVYLTNAGDGSNRLFVVEQAGIVRLIQNDPSVLDAGVFLDISAKVQNQGEEGLLGLAFDPDYINNGYFYVYYSALGPRRSVIERYQVSATDPHSADPGSAQVILEVPQPFPNHNGGTIAFGPDGYLYIGLGDGGASSDPYGHGQNTNTLLGSMLRIDPNGSTPYAIPPDNPFANSPGTQRKEIWAYGLRNPYRFSFDRATGDLWLADVGQNAWEEIDVIVKGGNYGWNVYEGNHAYLGSTTESVRFPVYEYSHALGRSITGGNVYRGTIALLQGAYLYADFYATGQVWALRVDPAANYRVLFNDRIPMPEGNVSAFGEDETGEVYVVSYSGPIHKFIMTAANTAAPIPLTLSETGLFYNTSKNPVAKLVATPGVRAYQVNTPLWSDYTKKRRWLALPGESSSIDFTAQDEWSFPVGTVLVKHFEIELRQGDPASTKHLETRILLKQEERWNGFTYRWRADQTDADLLTQDSYATLQISLADGTTKTQTYLVPGVDTCTSCHNSASKVLGVNTGQLNRASLQNPAKNQITALNEQGYFSSQIEDPQQYDAWVALDANAPLEQRARSYLAANCAHCHQPALPSPSTLDLRYQTPLAMTNTVNIAPLTGDLGNIGATLVTPGVKESSLLWLRMNRVDLHRMPPVASSEIHPQAVALIGAWIDSM